MTLQAVGVLILLLTATGALLALRSGTDEHPVRQIELVAQGMTFAGDNPILRVSAGETVEFLLINRDLGMLHDLSLPELDARSLTIAAGQETRLRVTFPQVSEETTLTYLCTYHAVTMRGVIEVIPDVSQRLLAEIQVVTPPDRR